MGHAVVDKTGFYRFYSLTPAGLEIGRRVLQEFTVEGREYAAAASKFVHSLSFNELVSKIYDHYPDMKVNSVFR